MSEPNDKQVEQPNPIAKVFGTWPGDETDADLQKDVTDLRVEQPKAGELPPYLGTSNLYVPKAQYEAMKQKLESQLRAEKQVSAGLRIELDTCAEKNKKLVKNNDKLVELVNEACDLGEAAEVSLAEAKLKIANLESQLNLKKGSD